jgi:HK97 family phage portal protein
MANLWQRFKGLFDSKVQTSAGGLLQGVLQMGTPARRGTRELLIAYRTHPWLHAVVWRLAQEVAAIPFELFQTKAPKAAAKRFETKGHVHYAPKDAKRLETHPLLALLSNPSPVFTAKMFWALVQAFLDTKGEVLLVVERAADGTPLELWPVPRHWVAELPHRSFSFYRFSYGTWQRTIPEADVIYLRHPELDQPYAGGVGTGETLADELDIDEFATKHLKSWFFNRALPDVFLSVEGVSSPAEAARYEEKLRAKHGGQGKAFQVHVTNGKVDLKEVGHTFREQQLPELRTQERDNVLQVYGMPPEIMGIVENSNRATIDAAVLILMRFLVCPRMGFLCDAFTHWARTEYQDPSLCLGFESPIPDDAEYTLKVMVAQPTLFTKNEWRQQAGKEPRDGWDEEFPEASSGGFGGAPALPAGDKPKPPKEDPPKEDDEEDKSAAGDRGLLRVVKALG